MVVPPTRHAEVRLQQRAIPPIALDLLWEFGSSARSRGADSLFFDRAARQRVAKALGDDALRRVDRLTNVHAVISDDGAVVTVGWRTRRRRRA